ncbi:glutathione S-transferase family protein [Trinickia violacea]|uniref:Glutathione S-transferase family protein n=1 Tax=Trinickia violacea TaxID=2571746 RepID=A0A4P8IY98_9BURK|nr:glutathione S-transferase family protein [Trinickia violacea]QCP54398.1 glutathione S-transferase family protein [Trinickia violacea]
MNLTLHYAVPSTYSQKTLLAFFEKGVPFTPKPVNLSDPEQSASYRKLYPLGKIPLLTGDDLFIPESTIIIEFLENEFPTSGTKLIPEDPTAARRVRFKDRMHDLYLNEPIATIFFDSLKPADKRNPEAVAKAHATLDVMYNFMNEFYGTHPDAGAGEFNMSDCAAFAPLFYAQKLHPFADREYVSAYFGRLMERPSVQRLLGELLPALQKFEQK